MKKNTKTILLIFILLFISSKCLSKKNREEFDISSDIEANKRMYIQIINYLYTKDEIKTRGYLQMINNPDQVRENLTLLLENLPKNVKDKLNLSKSEDNKIITANSSCRPSGDSRSSGKTNQCINTAITDNRNKEYRCDSGCVTSDYNLCCIQACCLNHNKSSKASGKLAASYENQLTSRGLDKDGNVVKQIIISDKDKPADILWGDDDEIGF